MQYYYILYMKLVFTLYWIIYIHRFIIFSVQESIFEMLDPFLKFILIDPKRNPDYERLRQALVRALVAGVGGSSLSSTRQTGFNYMLKVLNNMQVKTLTCKTALNDNDNLTIFMPPPFEEWCRGIKCYPCPCVRTCVRLSVRPSVIKSWCLSITFERLHRFNSNLVCWYIISKHRSSSIWVTPIVYGVMGLL